MVRTKGLKQAYLRGPLRNGNEHHIHGKDTCNAETDTRNSGNSQCQGTEDAVKSSQNCVLSDHSHVLFSLMSFSNGRQDMCLNLRNGLSILRFHKYAKKGVGVKEHLCRSHGKNHQLLHIKANGPSP